MSGCLLSQLRPNTMFRFPPVLRNEVAVRGFTKKDLPLVHVAQTRSSPEQFLQVR